MAKINDLVKGLGTGWSLVGDGQPVEELKTEPNPVASNPVPPAGADLSPTIQVGTGRYYVVVQDPEGHQRALWLTGAKDQGVGPPGVQPVVPITGTTPAPGTTVISDLKNASWDPGGPITDVPAGSTTKQPSPTSKLDKIDSKGNVIAPDDTTTKPTQLRDPATGTTINLVTDPAGTLHDLGNDVILVKPDGSYTKVASKPDKPTQFNVAGVGLVDYDPSKPDGQRTTVLIKTPDKTAPTTEVRNGKTYSYDNESKTWIETNLPAQADIGYTLNDPNSKWIIFYDKQGKEVSRTEKPDFKAPVNVQPGSAPAADQVSAKIPTFNPQTGALEFVDNPNQLKASAATEELAKQLGLKVAAGSMSEKQAQDIITGAVNTMNAQTAATNAATAQQTQIASAASDVMRQTGTNAQTGAGMLNQRVQSATGALQNIVGSAAGSNMMNVPAGLGQRLVGGLQAFTTELGGGQAVYDTAARMVQAADPKISGDPTLAQQAQQALAQMFQVYQQQNGRPAPQVAATQAAQQSQQSNAFAAPPPTVPPPTPVQQPAAVASGQVAPPAQVPGQNYGNSIAYTGGVAPSQYGFTPPGGSSYSYGGPVPWAGATPQRLPPGTPIPFIAPTT